MIYDYKQDCDLLVIYDEGSFMQVELGFGNSIVNEIFYVAGYDVRGFVVAQVSSPLGINTQ